MKGKSQGLSGRRKSRDLQPYEEGEDIVARVKSNKMRERERERERERIPNIG